MTPEELSGRFGGNSRRVSGKLWMRFPTPGLDGTWRGNSRKEAECENSQFSIFNSQFIFPP